MFSSLRRKNLSSTGYSELLRARERLSGGFSTFKKEGLGCSQSLPTPHTSPSDSSPSANPPPAGRGNTPAQGFLPTSHFSPSPHGRGHTLTQRRVRPGSLRTPHCSPGDSSSPSVSAHPSAGRSGGFRGTPYGRGGTPTQGFLPTSHFSPSDSSVSADQPRGRPAGFRGTPRGRDHTLTQGYPRFSPTPHSSPSDSSPSADPLAGRPGGFRGTSRGRGHTPTQGPRILPTPQLSSRPPSSRPPSSRLPAVHSNAPGNPRISPIPDDTIIVTIDASVKNGRLKTGVVARRNRDGSIVFGDVLAEDSHKEKGIDDNNSNYYETCAIRNGMREVIRRGLTNQPLIFINDNNSSVHFVNTAKKCSKEKMREVVSDVKRLKRELQAEVYGRVKELVPGVHELSQVRGERGTPEFESDKAVAMELVEQESVVFPLKPASLLKMITYPKSKKKK